MALDKQPEARKKKQDGLRQQKMPASQTDYATALTLFDMYYSPVC